MKPLLAIFLVLAASATRAQQPVQVRVPEALGRGLGVDIRPYEVGPPDLTLVPHGPGGRRGRVWVRNAGDGLVVAGEVDGGAADFPRNKNLILQKDHVEIWLAAADAVDLPEIGWGNQFGETLLPKGPDSCGNYEGNPRSGAEELKAGEKKCREWATTQQRYRASFQRLFVRQWLLTPDYAIESYATPAYQRITAEFARDQKMHPDEVPAMLKPRGELQMWSGVMDDHSGYTFLVHIPFAAFPPMANLKLSDFMILVDVFSPAAEGHKTGPYSTTSPNRVYGKPATFNPARLDPARTFHLTPCDMALKGGDAYQDVQDAWFVPKSSQVGEYESDAFLVVNGSGGYRYGPEGLSPVVRPLHYFWHNAGPGEWVCGPQLTYKNGERTEVFEYAVAEEGFDTRHTADGDLLVKSGPLVYYSEFGSGQCGACPRVELRVWGITPDVKIFEALALGDLVDNSGGASKDFSVSQDWSQITEFDQENAGEDGEPGSWSSTTWCLKKDGFEECGSKDDVQPPDPPVLKELRGPED